MEILEKNEHLGNVVSRNNLDSLILKIDNNRAAIEAGLSFLTSADSYLFTIDSHSGNGDGMTSLLRFLYGKVIHTEQVLFVSAERCSQRIEQNTYRKMLIESSILFIDDVCYLYRKQQKTELWHQILQARISFQRKTLCTLCMSSEELKLLGSPERYSLIYSGTNAHILKPSKSDKLRMAKYWMLREGVNFNVDFSVFENLRSIEGHINYLKAFWLLIVLTN